MKHTGLFLIVFLCLLFSPLTLATSQKYTTSTTPPEPLTLSEHLLYVDDNNINGPWNGSLEFPYQYIHQAVENATNEDTIFVFNGTYQEHVLINKQLTLLGENSSTTIIDGNYHEFIIQVTSASVTIENFTLRNAGGGMTDAAIKVNASDCHLDHCLVYRAKTGISLRNTYEADIHSCIFYLNGEGIGIFSSENCHIENCYFTHNALGISLERSHSIDLQGCYAQTNGIGYYFYYTTNSTATLCAAYDNNDNQGGFFTKNSTNITITNCNSNHNGVGVKITDSATITVEQSDLLSNTHAAVWTDTSSENIRIQQCAMEFNKRCACYLIHTTCIIFQNNIFNSLFGLYGEDSLIDARDNWWGSFFGPTLFDRTIRDRVIIKNGKLTVYPWRVTNITTAGSTWDIDTTLYHIDINTSRYTQITLPGNDTDNDGVPDWWEIKWGYNPNVWDDHARLDPDGDGLNNIEECYTDSWDSSPFHKDVFLEIDWMKSNFANASNKPSSFFIEKMVQAFATHNITLHVDEGSLGGGEEVTYRANFSFAELCDYYWNYFLHNDLNNPRKGIFHYCLVSDYGPSPGFSFIGWDHLDSFQISAQAIAAKGTHYLYPRSKLIVGGIIHELGHTLGLNVDDFGGIDNKVTTVLFTKQWWQYQAYRSCMNYWYTYTVINYSEGTHGKNDFNDWSHMDFSFFKNTSFEEPT